MQIHVARPPEQLGVFSPEEIAEGLRTGRFLATDQAWREGMAAWTPLNQWAEFSGVVSGAASVPPPTASQVPWEQGRSIGSFFATIKAALFSPRETFAHARMEIVDWLIFAYIVNLLMLPVRIVQVFVYEDINAQLLGLLERFDSPVVYPIVEGLRANVQAAELPMMKFVKIGSLVGNVLFAPLFLLLIGMFVWVALWILRQKVGFSRTLAVTLMASSVLAFCQAPLGFLGFNVLLVLGLSCVLFVPYLIFYCRTYGAGIQRSAWVALAAHALWVLMFVCCAGAVIGLIAAVAASVG